MATPTDLKLDGLNFEAIRDNLKSFLKSQSQFKDYNFDASGLAVLLDVLAYNTYYNSFYLNMVSTESFLTTAQKRNSVVALAKSLNYTPRSTSSAKITGTLTLTASGTPATVIVPKYTTFSASLGGGNYDFTTQEALTFVRIDNAYVLENITLVEGKKVSERYTRNINDVNQKFIINNANADISTLTVRVLNSSSDSTTRVFNRADNIITVDGDSLVYFIEEIDDGKYEVVFGDDITGKALVNGNIVYLDYLVSSGTAANEIQSIAFSGSVAGVTSIVFEADAPSYGGDEKESISRIKFNAPKSYATQNRAVTAEDYTALVLGYPNVGSAIVWGGEDNDPPYYGKVFIAIKPKVGNSLTATEKQNIIDFVINPKKILTITAEIVDPEYTYLIIEAEVKFDSTQNALSSTNLTSLVLDTIKNYNDTDLGEFSRYFRYSKLSRLIDTAERSIINSSLNVKMKKEVSIQIGTTSRYEISFSNAIDPITQSRPVSHPYNSGNKITSNEFSYNGYTNCFLEENGGVIRVYRRSGVDYVGVPGAGNIGTVDYENGKVVLADFTVESFADGGTTLKLIAQPLYRDILPLRTQIITIKDEDINITMIDDNTISLTRR